MSAAAESAPITIGALLPLTGEAAHWGIPPRNAAEMAVDEINRAGGIGGRKLALMIEDDRCLPPDGIAAFHKIMAAANPAVFLGAVCSGVTLAVAPLAGARRTVMISPASTSPKVTDAGDFIFRIIPSGSARGKIFAEYLHDERGLRRLAALYINNEGGIGGSSAFKARFTQLGGTVVIEEKYEQGATDLRAQLARIKATDAQGVLVGSYPPDTVLVLQQARELELRLPLFLTTEAVQNPDVLRQAGDAANGAVYILAAPAAGAAPQKFAEAYEARFGKKPELFAGEGYDIVRLSGDHRDRRDVSQRSRYSRFSLPGARLCRRVGNDHVRQERRCGQAVRHQDHRSRQPQDDSGQIVDRGITNSVGGLALPIARITSGGAEAWDRVSFARSRRRLPASP